MTSYENTGAPPGRGDFFSNDLTSLYGLPHGTQLGGNGVYAHTTAFGPQADHPPNAVLSEAPDRIQWATDESRRGNGCLLFELRHLDYGGASNNRNQIENSYVTDGTPDGRLYPGDDVWLAFSVKFPFGYPVTLSGSGVFFAIYQAFAASSDNLILGGSPPFALELQNTTLSSPSGADFSITVRGGNKATSGASSPVAHFTRILPATLGVWHDFLIHYKLGATSADATGKVQVWHRLAGGAFPPTPIYDYTGVNVTSVAGVDLGTEHSFGMYRNDRAETQRMYMGALICRRTRAEAMTVWDAIPTVTGPASWAAAIAADIPVGWWTLDDTSGTTAVDSSGNGNNGTYVNTPTLAASGAAPATGTAVTFNGSTQYVTIPHATSLDVGDTCSMEAWVKFSGSGTYIILSRGWDGSTNAPELSVTGGQLRFTIPQTQTIATASGALINDDAWHHVVATKAGADIHLYVDGMDVTNSGTINTTLANNTKAWTVGVRDQNGSFIDYFPGSIDEAAAYNYPLSSTQVLSHYFNKANVPAGNSIPTTTGTAAPTSGAHVLGEQVINTAPEAGGNIGWVCVGAGTPGTWKPYGVISL